MLEENGYDVRVFNLIDMAKSGHYNPFAYVFDKSGEVCKPYVIKMIDVLMRNTREEKNNGGDRFWDDAARALLSALSFYLLETDPENANWANVMTLLKLAKVKESDEDFESELDLLFSELDQKIIGSMAVRFYKDAKMAAGETLKSILISCSTRLQAFNLPEVADLTHKDTLELDKLGDKKTALFVLIPASDSTFNFLAAMMYTQLFDNLYDAANFRHGGRLPVHVRFLLDEFANIGAIPNFDKLIVTIRSREISACIILQAQSQLKNMYKDNAETIIGNCDTALFLGGKEKTTLKDLSESLGKETIDMLNSSVTKGNSPSFGQNYQKLGKELMSIDEISVMDGSKCILQLRGVRPFLSDKFDITKHKNYRYLSDFDERNAFNMKKFVTRELKVKDTDEFDVYNFDATTEDAPPEAFADNQGIHPDETETLDDTAFDPTDTELF